MAAKMSAPDRARGDCFVGRREEMEILHSLVLESVDGTLHFVVVSGEAGIGKTRIAEEASRVAAGRGMRVCWGRCHDDGGAPPYWPWIQILRACGADELSRRLIDEPVCSSAGGSDPLRSRFLLFDAVARHLVQAATRSPLCLVVDNLQWADQTSRDFMEFLAQEMSHVRMLVLGTYRGMSLSSDHPLSLTIGELARHPGYFHLGLRGLSPEEVAEMVRNATPGAMSPRFIRRLCARTGGNPLFVTELLKSLPSQTAGAPRGTARRPRGAAVPGSVVHAIRRRLAGYPDTMRDVLSTAALLGREFELPLLGSVMQGISPEEILKRCEDAVRAGFLLELSLGRYRFAHGLVRDALRQDIPHHARAKLHGRMGAALERKYGKQAGAHTAELAYHFSRSQAAADAERAFRYSVTSGEAARRACDFSEAASHFRRALGVRPDSVSADRVGVAELGLARALAGLARGGEALGHSLRAYELFESVGDVPRAVQAATVFPVDQYTGVRGARHVVARALALVRERTPEWALLTAYRCVSEFMDRPCLSPTIKTLDRAVESATAAGENAAEITIQLAAAILEQLSLTSATPRLQRIIRLAGEIGDMHTLALAHLGSLSELWYFPSPDDPPDAARKHLDAAVYAAEALRARDLLCKTLISVGKAHYFRGAWERAREALDRAQSFASAAPWPSVARSRALVEYQTGRRSEGDRILEALLSRQRDLSSQDGGMGNLEIAWLIAERAHLTTDVANLEEAAETLRGILAAPATQPMGRWRGVVGLGLIAAEQRDGAAAAGYLGDIRSMRELFPAVRRADDLLVAITAVAAGDDGLAAECLGSALKQAQRTGNSVATAWACYGLGALLTRRPELSEGTTAAAMLLRASSMARDMKMLPLEERCKAVSAPDRLANLTPREREVLCHVALGKTNQEISRDLGISEHTVAAHIRNILRKAGVTNRVDAAILAVRHGLGEGSQI